MKFTRARLDSVKWQFVFNTNEAMEGKKLFFEMMKVHDGGEVEAGNEVEFVIVQNQHDEKYSAYSLCNITDSERPESLPSRMKSIKEDMYGPRVVAVRQPKAPNGTNGPKETYKTWTPPRHKVVPVM